MKAISSIFSTLIVIMITISLILPLYLYFNQIYGDNKMLANEAYGKYLNIVSTKVSLIPLGSSTNEIFVYNYGQNPVVINKVIINTLTFNVKYTVGASDLVPLSEIIGNNLHLSYQNTTIILEINGNYYYFNFGQD
ncbi:archaellin/type IV pilin N-terminal domain-containing protein [Sulfolobus tengchongensis]|uniref:Archaellin/type IV pilin N-terminal domain-containing protein n=1 Tax=Sulfolobus tengchongensis TaxID=207809 RepID=A0AAX4KZA8_9CREN